MVNEITDAVKHAASTGDLAALRQLLDTHGVAVVRGDDNPGELTTLHWAAATGNVETVRFLMDLPIGADPCAARGNNFTPLHAAAMHGHTEVCETLLAAGADVNAQTNPQGYAPLHSAAFAGHVETIRVLLDYGANRELLNYRGERPVDTARRTGQAEAVRMLEV